MVALCHLEKRRKYRNWRKDLRGSKAVPLKEKPVRGELISVDEASRYIRLGKTSIYACAKDGLLSFSHPPIGILSLDTAVLDDWLRMSKISAGTVPGYI